MARAYSIDGKDTIAAPQTVVELRSTTAIRPRIYDVMVGSEATPADMAAEWTLARTTTVGSGGSAITPQSLDPDDPAAVASGREADTTEPSYTANEIMLAFALNQRATFRWVAVPGREIVLPAAANGVGLKTVVVNGSGVICNACIHFEE